jgi:protein TonB
MYQRKSDKANLDKARRVFLSIGLLLISGIVFSAFTYRTYTKSAYDFSVDIGEELAEIPQIVQPPKMPEFTPPPPPKPKDIEIEIVPDEVKTPEKQIEEVKEKSPENLEPIVEAKEPDEVLVPLPFMFSNDMPFYSECAGLKGKERDKCTVQAIHRNIKEAFVLPSLSKELGEEGTVYVRFVLNTNGVVSKVEVLKGVSERLDKAAIEAVRKLPKANPGMHEGKPSSFFYTVPIKINLR